MAGHWNVLGIKFCISTGLNQGAPPPPMGHPVFFGPYNYTKKHIGLYQLELGFTEKTSFISFVLGPKGNPVYF
jgi:hypothetical protein